GMSAATSPGRGGPSPVGRCDKYAANICPARWSVSPGFNRPMTETKLMFVFGSETTRQGCHTSVPAGKSNDAGMTPTTVRLTPSSTIVVPITDGFALKRLRQSASERMNERRAVIARRVVFFEQTAKLRPHSEHGEELV